jgi:hypothetical protein
MKKNPATIAVKQFDVNVWSFPKLYNLFILLSTKKITIRGTTIVKKGESITKFFRYYSSSSV